MLLTTNVRSWRTVPSSPEGPGSSLTRSCHYDPLPAFVKTGLWISGSFTPP
jgi:hypothetical protein